MQSETEKMKACNEFEAHYMPVGLKLSQENVSAIWNFIDSECGGLFTVSNLVAACKVLVLEYEKPVAHTPPAHVAAVPKKSLSDSFSAEHRSSLTGVRTQTGRMT